MEVQPLEPAQPGPHFTEAQLSQYNNLTLLSSADTSPLKENSLQVPNDDIIKKDHQNTHTPPPLQATDIESIFEGTTVSMKQIYSLIRDQATQTNEPIWTNFLMTVYNSQLPKKVNSWIVKEVLTYLEGLVGVTSNLIDNEVAQQEAILAGYAMLAIWQIKACNSSALLNESERYFVELDEKQITRESVKIGYYIAKIILKISKEQNYQAKIIFERLTEKICGKAEDQRRTIVQNWTSSQRQMKFCNFISNIGHPKAQIGENLKQHPGQCAVQPLAETQREILANVPIALQQRPKEIAKQLVLQEEQSEYTSCEEELISSVKPETALEQLQKPDITEANLILNEENPLTQLDITPENNIEQRLTTPINHNQQPDIHEPEGDHELNEQPERDFLGSTADTSNIFAEVANEQLEAVPAVIENQEENQEVVQPSSKSNENETTSELHTPNCQETSQQHEINDAPENHSSELINQRQSSNSNKCVIGERGEEQKPKEETKKQEQELLPSYEKAPQEE